MGLIQPRNWPRTPHLARGKQMYLTYLAQSELACNSQDCPSIFSEAGTAPLSSRPVVRSWLMELTYFRSSDIYSPPLHTSTPSCLTLGDPGLTLCLTPQSVN